MSSDYDCRAVTYVALRTEHALGGMTNSRSCWPTLWSAGRKPFRSRARVISVTKGHDRYCTRKSDHEVMETLQDLIIEDSSVSTRTVATKLVLPVGTFRNAIH